MPSNHPLLLLALAPAVAYARGADASQPHPHRGTLTPYKAQPPSKYGLDVGNVPLKQLRSGKPVLRLVEVGNGFKRTVSIQDVQAPPSVVWSRIMDLPKYPKMVEGCVSCVPYKREKRVGGTQVVYAKYKIRAAALAMEYFMKHTFEPGKNCMTFHLDYDRLSELFDTVGYWYVEKLSDGWCRVYYSTDSAVPAWVPGFMKDSLVKLSAARSTSWVDVECQKEMGLDSKSRGGWFSQLRRIAKLTASAAVAGWLLRGRTMPWSRADLRGKRVSPARG